MNQTIAIGRHQIIAALATVEVQVADFLLPFFRDVNHTECRYFVDLSTHVTFEFIDLALKPCICLVEIFHESVSIFLLRSHAFFDLSVKLAKLLVILLFLRLFIGVE